MTTPRILIVDIENAPNLAHVWSLWNENIQLDRLLEAGYTMSWAAKWYKEKEIFCESLYTVGKDEMVRRIHSLMDEADAVVTYNGNKHDLPILNQEFLLAGHPPTAPSKSLDLYQVVKSRFKFPSNRLAYVAKALGLSGKLENGGHRLWVQCMEGDSEAWANLENYNRQDVVVTEELYDKLSPWIKNPINQSLFREERACPACGSEKNQRRGFAYTKAGKYPRYQCMECGHWHRSGKSESRGPSERSTSV